MLCKLVIMDQLIDKPLEINLLININMMLECTDAYCISKIADISGS